METKDRIQQHVTSYPTTAQGLLSDSPHPASHIHRGEGLLCGGRNHLYN